MAQGFERIHAVREITDIKDLLYSGIAEYGNGVAFKEKSKKTKKYENILYKDYVKEVEALGSSLIELGLKDSYIVVIGENRYKWATSYMAVLNGVGTIVPMDKELPEHEILNLIEACKPKAIIYSGLKEKEISSLSKKNDFVDFYISMDAEENTSEKMLSYDKLIDRGNELLSTGYTDYTSIEIDAQKISILLYTSATTSKSKAVPLSHHNLATNLMAMSSVLYIAPTDVFLSFLPLHHTYECTCGFLCPLYRGAAIAYCEGVRHIKNNLLESDTTVFLGVPLLFEKMYKGIWNNAEKAGSADKLKKAIKISNFFKKFKIDLTRKLFKSIYSGIGSNLRIFISGAAALNPTVAEFYRSIGISFYQGYGLTECSPILCLNSDTDFEDASAGKGLPGLDLIIMDKNSDGIGEICVKGDSIMKGYVNQDELNKEVFEGGYFHTGDLGYMDDRNFVYITGRKKSVIITKNGKNVYPEEVEAFFVKYPYIFECMLFGKTNAAKTDIVLTLAVIPDKEAFEIEFKSSSKETIDKKMKEIIKEVNEKLVPYKTVKKYIIREDEFIKTTTGKIKRYVEENQK